MEKIKEWNRRGQGYFLIILVLAMAIIGGIMLFQESKNTRNQCLEDFGRVNCNQEDYCSLDCKELGKEYLKYEFSSGLFSSTIRDCFCKKDGDVQQIW